MHVQRALLITIGLGLIASQALLAQRGSAGPITLPSSTALGAGALTTHPSSTARSTGPAVTHSGYLGGGGYGYASGYRGANHSDHSYHRLPRSYFIAPYYYPVFDSSGGTDVSVAPPEDRGVDYGPDPATDAMLQNQAALGQQVQRLTDQLNNLMAGQQQPTYAPQPAAPQPQQVPLTLVLRSGEHLQITNYAITNNTLWDFGQRSTRKIPLSNIDLAASEKATEAAGGEFPDLNTSQVNR
jgi:hypothetical protein